MHFGFMHWTSINVEAKVHYFVTILEHKVNTQFLIKFIHDINILFVFLDAIRHFTV